MYTINQFSRVVRESRELGMLTQQELADRVGTSQSAIAALERGGGNPTVSTLERCAAAAGFALRIVLDPLPPSDPIIERYKRDVDRTLLRENLRRTVEQRLTSLSEWQEAGNALQQATARKLGRHTRPQR